MGCAEQVEGQQKTSSTDLKVGKLGSGYHASALLKIPLNQLPTPSNARVTNAELSMWAQSVRIPMHKLRYAPCRNNGPRGRVNPSYDGLNNWSADGGRGIDLMLVP